MNYNLSNLKPSDLRQFETDLILDTARTEFVDRVVQFISYEDHSVANLDTVYCNGAMLGKCFAMLTKDERDRIMSVDTNRARAFVDGLQGREFSPEV